MTNQQEKKTFFGEPKQTPELKVKETTPTKEEPSTTKKEEWLKGEEGQLSIDVYQTPKEIVIKSTIAGVKPEDVDVSINNDMVTIKGERKKDITVSDEDYFYQECYWGKFSRSVILPQEIEVNKVEAEIKDGILTVILPKSEKARSKKIQVEAK